MRYIRHAFLLLLGTALVAVAVANSAPVELRLLSDGLSDLTGLEATLELPLYLVIFGGIVAGLLIGFVWEWLREHRIRVEAAAERSERQRLERELRRVRRGNGDEDEVLALLDG